MPTFEHAQGICSAQFAVLSWKFLRYLSFQPAAHQQCSEVMIQRYETKCRVATCRQKDTALHWAAFKGHAEVVQALLQAGANPVSTYAHLQACTGESVLSCLSCVKQLVLCFLLNW